MNGGWGHWGSWSSWSTCIHGNRRTRTRLCNNPSPSQCAKTCSGTSSQSKPCFVSGYLMSWDDYNYIIKTFLNTYNSLTFYNFAISFAIAVCSPPCSKPCKCIRGRCVFIGGGIRLPTLSPIMKEMASNQLENRKLNSLCVSNQYYFQMRKLRENHLSQVYDMICNYTILLFQYYYGKV